MPDVYCPLLAGPWPQHLCSRAGNRRSHRVCQELMSKGRGACRVGAMGQCGEKVKVTQKVQEAHRGGTTNPPQQPGPAQPSGTHHPIPTALSEMVCTMGEPSSPRCNPQTPPGKLWGSQARTGVSLPGIRAWRGYNSSPSWP